ncbi:hypothetical protein QCE73_04865 [Caballeronia sp. LZ029]|uniref:hypothetical protein n=1 Tax=Caballeronia sp. LZ029 TaxID=3038564 RepID=UPI00285E536E|nr:hypothetical protein [Caballeronia sp. LZ029]MDR5742486.1 hypothetical protein [Caballeronia sp. LZ029]
MNELKVFVSVGGTATDQQESFVRAVENRLRAEGLIPCTVGRNTFSSDSPLKTVVELMNNCSGTVVIALERKYFSNGIEKRGGPSEVPITNVALPTPWNQIEAAMAYSRGHPLLVIVEQGISTEGLLEPGFDWYVQVVELKTEALTTIQFNSVLASWKGKLSTADAKPMAKANPSEMTVSELIGNTKPSQLYSFVAAIFALVAGAFALGAKLHGG